jgi:anti-sigma-K factor RskA
MVRFHRGWERDAQTSRFGRLRGQRWNRLNLWRYLALAVLVALLFLLLRTMQ